MAIDRMLRNVTLNTTTWYPDGSEIDDCLSAVCAERNDTIQLLYQTYELEAQGTYRIPGSNHYEPRMIRKVTDERVYKSGRVTKVTMNGYLVKWAE